MSHDATDYLETLKQETMINKSRIVELLIQNASASQIRRIVNKRNISTKIVSYDTKFAFKKNSRKK